MPMALHGPGRASRRPATWDVESGAAAITCSTLHRSPTASTLGGGAGDVRRASVAAAVPAAAVSTIAVGRVTVGRVRNDAVMPDSPSWLFPMMLDGVPVDSPSPFLRGGWLRATDRLQANLSTATSRSTRKMPRNQAGVAQRDSLFFGSGGSDYASRPFRIAIGQRLVRGRDHSSEGLRRARRRRRRLRTPVSTESYRRARADTPRPMSCRRARAARQAHVVHRSPSRHAARVVLPGPSHHPNAVERSGPAVGGV